MLAHSAFENKQKRVYADFSVGVFPLMWKSTAQVSKGEYKLASADPKRTNEGVFVWKEDSS